ncbi:T9SS type A sorting domain-containing protein [Tamlana sp. s12]|uniref:pectate lyase family protein n=1 Tax=Tamlana sp. s12 TaxID=1630406 RepID=UPI00192BBAFE|nr:T9SS type A sorting domain-containing protein [Tamlana sp. s12]QQY81127.1 T9SS type A sorting domain-containing protein [Tamlana sp. s12]
MKKTVFSLAFLLASFLAIAQSVTINEASGWFETANVKWTPVSGADSYNVYYSGQGISNRKIDTQLIRGYGSYYRADVLGLKAGQYTIKVAPVFNGSEGSGATTSNITVKAHDRTGFSFSNGRVPGAYKEDGTPKDNAVILYLTENTKNTVSLDVTGASSNPCVGIQTILEGFKKGKDTRPLIIRLIGQVTDMSYMQNGDIVIENSNNASSYITLEGVGDDATADGWGIRIKNATNIEVRNIGTMNCDSGEGDNIGLQQNNQYVWVHNCDFFYGDAGGDSDQAKGDGALDCKKSTYVTFSYNHFWDAGKSNLLGLSENTTEGLYITYHHNWYDHSDSRHPRVRFYSAHVYNNYYDGIAKYGVGSTKGSSVFVEGNYFRNCKYPMLTSMQGSDVYDESEGSNDYSDMPTFSKEDGGTIKAYNNYLTGQKRFVAYGDSNYSGSTTDFDAYVVTSKSQTISSSVKSSYGSNTYNNFDNSSAMYSYTADSPQNAKTNVTTYSGRQEGGDFNFTFNNSVDDTSYAVNSALKSALVNYNTSLQYIQGEGTPPIIPTDPSISLTANAGDGSVTLNWTTANLSASTFAVYRNTSSNTSGRTKLTDLSSSATSYTDNSVDNGTTYYYWVQANGNVESNSQSAKPDGDGEIITPPPAGGTTHNFTTSGTSSSVFSISGNLSDSKGTVNYAGLTLTQCLKIESSTSIAFNAASSGSITLVFNEGWSGSIKIDGNNVNVSGGELTQQLSAGSHTITKGDTANLYYMILSTGDVVNPPPGDPSVSLSASVSGTNVNLSWTASNITVDALEIYRDIDSDPAGRTKIATLAPDARFYSDNTAAAETTYYYWVKVSNDYSSNAAQVTTPDSDDDPDPENPPIDPSAIYVANNGSASNSGSINSPKTFESALSSVSSGGTIYVKGGKYNFSSTIVITKNGSSSSKIKVFGYDGMPVLSFAAQSESSSNRGIVLDGNYWHFKDITIEEAGDNGMLLSGNYNTIESCIFRSNHDTGLQLSRYNTNATSISDWPSHNLILNCEAYDNRDSDNEDADGFAAKLTCGVGNTFRGCVAHHNIDDGWDLYTKSDTGPIGVVTFEDCIAHSNGTLTTGGSSGGGDKNGFKLGSSAHKINHIVRRCIAFNNGKHGFTDNGNIGAIEFTNNTTYNNGEYNIHTRDGASHIFKNNISLGNSQTDRIRGNYSAPNAFINIDGTLTASSSDFVTLSPGPNADPTSNGFLNLKSSSNLIDAGVTTSGIDYSGSRPDLGAVEYGLVIDQPEDPVVSLNAVATETEINLNWTLVEGTATSYELYRDTDADPAGRTKLTNIASVNITNYTDNTAAVGTTYYYWIKANGSFNSNAASATISAPDADPVVSLNAVATETEINLNWTLVEGTATSYELYRDTDADPAGRTKLANIASVDITSYTDNTAAVGTTYYYWIKSNGAFNSNAASATISAPGNSISLTATPGEASISLNWNSNFAPTSIEVYRDLDSNPSGRVRIATLATSATSYVDATAQANTEYFYWIKANGSINSNYASATIEGSIVEPTEPTRIEVTDAGTIAYDGSIKYYDAADFENTINLSNSARKQIIWNFDAPVSGNYTVTLRYTRKATMNPTVNISFNGNSQTLSLPATESSAFARASLVVALNAGNNEIVLTSNADGESADIDWIEFELIAGSAKEASGKVTDEDSAFAVSVFPNPATDFITVKLSGSQTSKIEIYNTLGQFVYSNTQASGAEKIDLRPLQSGMYLLKVTNGSTETLKRFIKR